MALTSEAVIEIPCKKLDKTELRLLEARRNGNKYHFSALKDENKKKVTVTIVSSFLI